MPIDQTYQGLSGFLYPSSISQQSSGAVWSNANNLLTPNGVASVTIDFSLSSSRYIDPTWSFRVPANAQSPFAIDTGPSFFRCIVFRLVLEARITGSFNNPVVEGLAGYRNKKDVFKSMTGSEPLNSSSFNTFTFNFINSFFDRSSDPDDVQADFGKLLEVAFRVRDTSPTGGSANVEVRNARACCFIYRETFPFVSTGVGIN